MSSRGPSMHLPFRNRRATRSLAIALLTLAPAALVGFGPGRASPAADPRVDRMLAYLDATARLGRISGAVLVAEEGRILVDTAYGDANRELGVRNSAETRFRVASVTKQFSAMAARMLEEDGRLRFDDPISRWLDSIPEAWHAVTVRDLVRHTSGISDYEGWFGGWRTQAYSDYMAQADAPGRIARDARARPLDFAPGTAFHYSNSAYVLLGYVIARASGMSYEDFVRTRILAPLGMGRSLMDRSDEVIADRAEGYRLRDGAFPVAYFNGLTRTDLQHAHYQLMVPPQAEAGLVTTIGDLYRWDQALYTERLVHRATLDSIFTPGLGDYGDGWFIRRGPDGITHEHSGGLPGFTCYIMRIPEHHRTIILLQNLERLGPVVRDLAAIMRGDSVALPVARHLVAGDSTREAGWRGTYRDGSGDSIADTIDGSTLVATWPGHFATALYPEAGGGYFAVATNGTARFVRGAGGTSFTIEDGFGRAVVAARREAGR